MADDVAIESDSYMRLPSVKPKWYYWSEAEGEKLMHIIDCNKEKAACKKGLTKWVFDHEIPRR